MKRIVMALGLVLATGLLLGGCGKATIESGGSFPGRPLLPAAVPFSQLHAGPLDTVDFISSTVGYVGGEGLILKSTDGGRTWMKLYAGPENIRCLDVVNGNNVWAAGRDHLLHSTDGLRFKRMDFAQLDSGGSGRGIQAIDFPDSDQGFILAGGTIWRLTAGGANLERATPPAAVDSLDFTSPRNGFAAAGNRLYKTADGGRTWNRIFTAPVLTSNQEIPWQASVRAASANNVWLLIAGGGAGMSQLAYVVFHTTNGRSFTPVLDEGYFASLYPAVHLAEGHNLGAQPGPFAVCGNRTAIFLGWYPDQLQLTRTADAGRTFAKYKIGGTDVKNAPNFFSPLAISCVNGTHAWLAGNRSKRGIILCSTDGKHFAPVP